MKSRLLGSLLRLGIAALLWQLPHQVLLVAQPKINVEKNQLDLGTVYNGSTKIANVVIKNTGNESLKILGIRTSCGCTKAKEPKEFLKPGESDILQVGFDATGFRGPVVKYVNIDSNDPQNPSLSLSLTADVREELVPESQASVMWLGNLPLGKQTQRSIVFRNISGRSITITSSSSNSKTISLQMDKKKIAPQDSIKVNVSIVPEYEGYFSGEFILHTDSPNQSRVPMRVTYIAVR